MSKTTGRRRRPRMTTAVQVAIITVAGTIIVAAFGIISTLIEKNALPPVPTQTPTPTATSIPSTPLPFTATSAPNPVTPTATLAPPTSTPWPLEAFTSYTDNSSLCSVNPGETSDASRAVVLKITFTIPNAGGYCSLVFPLHNFDASAKTALTFWVKGEKGEEQFEVGILDSNHISGQEIKITQAAANTWQQVSISLTDFTGQDLRSLANFSLGFNFGLGSGTIYVDDFVFAP